MPTYTYRCKECGHKYDLFHGISDDSEKFCPECGATSERMIGGGSGLSIKGGSYSRPTPAPAPARFT